jgi:4'-phosphopantetheinyl transferase EntD
MSQVYLCFAAPGFAWTVRLAASGGKVYNLDEVWLTPREASLLAEIKSPRRRRDWLAGRCAAKELIRSYLLEREGLALARSHIEILNDENGAPKVLLPLNLEISIAHSGGHGLAGLCAHSPLGVDLQQIRPVRPDLIERVLTERERAQLAQHFAGDSDSLEGTLVFWALKEAAIKVHRARPAPAWCEIAVRLTGPGRAEILLCSQRLQAQWGRWKEFIWAWAVG